MQRSQIKRNSMHPIKKAIYLHQSSLCPEIDIIGLRKRNPVAHKWKVTYQSLCLRETVAWRFNDILKQSWMLHENDHALGARILLRSSLETIAILVFLNQLTEDVVGGAINFNDFMKKVLSLLTGSRDGSTDQKSTNIITIFEKCEKKHAGIVKMYAWLSESAHPNYEGMRVSYSSTDPEKMVTTFANHTNELYSKMYEDGIITVLSIFEGEYNYAWESGFLNLESWLEKNDEHLTSFKKNGP